MTMHETIRVVGFITLGIVFHATVFAARPPASQERSGKRAERAKSSPDDDQAARQHDVKEVELFEAIENRQVEAFVVARNFSLLTFSLRNRTAEPLLVRGPEVFAALPARRVAARQMARMRGAPLGGTPNGQRFAYGYGATGRNSAHGGNGGSQGLGGAFYNPDPIRQLARGGGSMDASKDDDKDSKTIKELPRWLLQPGRVLTQPLPCFCLEFGKPDPTRRIPYVLRPLKELNQDPTVRELLLLFGRKRVTQRISQIALWHVANQVPWPMLAQVELPRSQAGGRRKFSLQELQAARALVMSLPSYRNRFRGGMNPGMR